MKKSMIALLLAGLFGAAHAATDADVDNAFSPYRNGMPSFPGLSAGMTINKGNADQFKEILGAGVYKLIKDGLFEIKVGPTTDFALNKAYVAATKANLNKAKLGAKPGELIGYVAGRPFPEEPDLNDPRAGEKLAWNFRYGLNWGDNAAVNMIWKYKNMETGREERRVKMDIHFLNFKHRVLQQPTPEVTPNPSQIFKGTYLKVWEPNDVRNTQLLIQRFEDDLKVDDAYLYLGFQKRVRRMATGQTTDAFLGSDMMIEDFEGYNGRISDMKWTFKGKKLVLLPAWNHNELALSDEFKDPDGYKYISFGGQGGCFLNGSWQLRKVYVLEAAPVNSSHPVSKRVFYMDAQMGSMNGANEIYDRKGDLWKVLMVGKSHADHHLPQNKGMGIGVDDGFSIVDVQSRRCTTAQFKGRVDPKLSPPEMFQVQYMRGNE
ncbi:MAG TPA: DUF1329 domain-containing protein [Noviherbaspirillum sp.]|uniref:DUF1329 domain-containing protein n=1 Tax=Noviherbaspirillum sp. TaxID=1926288 RepID=UPI002B468A27|nr:DUF1329 domain-containing protein [Noviherbaspirillum sp.]HJV84999.1 DUF1329 domain-containing protein [Noviherbaspirillum sp.]